MFFLVGGFMFVCDIVSGSAAYTLLPSEECPRCGKYQFKLYVKYRNQTILFIELPTPSDKVEKVHYICENCSYRVKLEGLDEVPERYPLPPKEDSS